jgi:hypothetical protein
MTQDEAKIAEAFGNTPEKLARYGHKPYQIEYNSDAARIAAAFGHVLEPAPAVGINAERRPGTDARREVVFGKDRAL